MFGKGGQGKVQKLLPIFDFLCTNADMIQDLSDLAALGKANTEPLIKIGMDLTLLDKAEKLSGEMAKLLAA